MTHYKQNNSPGQKGRLTELEQPPTGIVGRGENFRHVRGTDVD